MSLRSRYILAVLSLLLAALFVRLGFWQLSRLRERRQSNAVAAAARAAPVLDLNRAASDGPRANRRVRVTGAYDYEHEVVLRGHVYRELPGVQVVTPLLIQGQDSAVMVNRGFVPSPDATFAVTDSLVEPGLVTVEGVALPLPVSDDSGGPMMSQGKETWRRLDLHGLRQRLPYPVLEVYILQSPDSTLPIRPRRLEPPPLDSGPHLSYAVQWFSFAVIAVAGTWIFLLKQER